MSALLGYPPAVMSFVSRSGCLGWEKVASVNQGWAGKLGVAWRGGFLRKVKGGGSLRPSGKAEWLPQPALP